MQVTHVRCGISWMVVIALTGCPRSSATDGDDVSPQRAVADAEPSAAKAEAKAPPQLPPGRLSDGVLPLTQMIGHAPPQVETHLGEPLGKGMMRQSCVRYVPDKVWFRCEYAWQRYQDPSGKVDAVQVSYEDGKATAIALEGLPGEGPFDPRAALALAGLELPGEPRTSSPAEDTQLWSWFNDTARLRIDGRQYRVEVSSVGDSWKGSKVEMILNEALTDEQKARRLQVEPKQPGSSQP